MSEEVQNQFPVQCPDISRLLPPISTLGDKVLGSEESGSRLDHVCDGQLYEMASWDLVGHGSTDP